MRLPEHIGIIPDGNRRWAVSKGMPPEKGYEAGIVPGLDLLRQCRQSGIRELTFYGFTTDNTKRASCQRKAFTDACINAVQALLAEDVSLLVVGNGDSPMFPRELLPYTHKRNVRDGAIKVNLLVNYGWEWDLSRLKDFPASDRQILPYIRSRDVSRIDLIIRWGGRRRLSGFLPVQSIYADFYVVDDLWPDFTPSHLPLALDWFNEQDVTRGG